MNNHAPRTVLKVDSTSLTVNRDFCVVIYNINIPQDYLTDRNELRNVLDRIQLLLVRDFANLSVLYQISASYILKHGNTGETRTWTGSFFARNNVLGVVAGFQQFRPDTFVTNSLTQLINVEQKLLANGFDTDWKFDELLSIIFNIQCKMPANTTTNRQHRTFAL